MDNIQNINTESILAQFVTECVATQQIWGLKSELGWTVAVSNQFENAQVYVFWSSKQAAERCAKEEWEDYKPATISLSEFLEDWCVGIFEENSLIGVQWDYDLCGEETESMELAQQLIQEIKRNNCKINFSKYPTVQALSNLIDKAILDDQDFSA